ncbi:hypothetical protein TEA_014136 [Camellia sinensis var. sinensis]|uniref:Uncharacterized protein n=1 Tax=Camellia sinensis var. sinensis TaxID=542762 RepID=A0A4S4DZX4_CAMSN|nr:hypothetical protein TEA_014136 [Camellia sinensis var. sinensis]
MFSLAEALCTSVWLRSLCSVWLRLSVVLSLAETSAVLTNDIGEVSQERRKEASESQVECWGRWECVSVGEDGRVNLVSVGNSNLSHRRFFNSNGLVSYTAAKWASPMEFATGGLGFSLQWWDQRKPGGPASQFKGGSSGTVFAWDLRWQQQPIVLSGVAAEDGILAVVEQGMKFVAVSGFFHLSAPVERLKVRSPLNSWLNHVLSTALTLTDRTPRCCVFSSLFLLYSVYLRDFRVGGYCHLDEGIISETKMKNSVA